MKARPELLQKLLEDPTIPEMTRCQLCASMLLTEWQRSRRYPANHPPSFILVNAGPQPDPCMQMARAGFYADVPKRRPPPVPPRFDPITQCERSVDEIELAERAMRMQVHDAKKYGPSNPKTKSEIERAQVRERQWREKYPRAFGSVKAGFYTRHIHPHLGVATDDSNRVSLWVTSPEDLARYKGDLKKPNSILWNPWGYDSRCAQCEKHLSLIGSITLEEWSADLVENIVESSMPVVFLPHIAPQSPVAAIDEFEFYKIQGMISFAESHIGDKTKPPDCRNFPGKFRAYEALLRYRLRMMPADYEYHILQLIRHLHTRLAYLRWTWLNYVDQENKEALSDKLLPMVFENAIRGIAMGVESLVFHGYGILVGVELALAKKMLTHIRQHGPCSNRDLTRRFQKVDKGTHATLLQQFEREGLIVRDQKQFSAVSCRDFLASLPNRRLMPAAMAAIQPQAAPEPAAVNS